MKRCSLNSKASPTRTTRSRIDFDYGHASLIFQYEGLTAKHPKIQSLAEGEYLLALYTAFFASP